MSLVLLFYDDFKGWSAVQVDAVPRPSMLTSEHLAFAIDPVALTITSAITPVALETHPDRIDRPFFGAHEQQFTAQNIRPEETIQLDWAPSYPERALRAWMLASSRPTFTTSVQPERTSSLADAVFPFAVYRPALRAESQRAVTDIPPNPEETKQDDWSPSFPDRASKPFLPVAHHQAYASTVKPEEAVQSDWQPVYPERAMRAWLPTAELAYFTTSPQPERNAPMWSVAYPDAVLRPFFVVSEQLAVTEISPQPERIAPIAVVVHPDRIVRPFLPVALHPFVTGEEPQPEERIDLDWNPAFPDRATRAFLATSEQPFFVSIQQPERTQAIASTWWPDRIDRPTFAASEQVFATGLSPKPEDRIDLDWPSVFAERVLRATLPIAEHLAFAISQQPEQTIAAAWQPSYPDRASRAWFLADKQPAFAFYPFPISAAPTIGYATYPDAFPPRVFPAADQQAFATSQQPERTSPIAAAVWPDRVVKPFLLAAQHPAFTSEPPQPEERIDLDWSPFFPERATKSWLATGQHPSFAFAPAPERTTPIAVVVFADRVDRPAMLVSEQLAVTGLSPKPEERLQLDWQGAYPDRATRAFLASAEHLPFALYPVPIPSAFVQNFALEWHPDRIDRPTFGSAEQPFTTSLSPFPISTAALTFYNLTIYPDGVVRPVFAPAEQLAVTEISPQPERKSSLACTWHPDRIDKPYLLTGEQLAVTGISPRPEERIPLDWSPSYPERARKVFLGVEEHPFFFPAAKPERTAPIASVVWPDAVTRPSLPVASHPFWTISAQPEQRLSTGTAVFPERVVRPTYGAAEQPSFAGPAKLEPFTRVDWEPKYPDRALHPWLSTSAHPAFTTSQRPELTVALAWEPVYPERATKAFLGTAQHPFFFSIGLAFVIPGDAIVRLTNAPTTRIVIHYAKSADTQAVDAPQARIVVEQTTTTVIDVDDAPTTRVTIMADQNIYDVGDTAELRASFKVKGVLTTPTTLTAEVKLDGTLMYTLTLGTDPSLTMESTGVALATIDCTAAGQWSVYFKGTGAAKGAETALFRVRAKP